MKKVALLCLTLLLVTGNLFAQKSVCFYGVDFSLTKVRGCDETVEDFQRAFYGINELFMSQSDKFDVGKFLLCQPKVSDLGIGAMSGAKLHTENSFGGVNPLLTMDWAYSCEEQIPQAIKNYKLQQTEGEGLVIFGNLLDKLGQRGSFCVVTFDIATREVTSQVWIQGNPSGFGLRNYWANSLHRAMKMYSKFVKK